MNAAQATYLVFLIKLVISGALVAIWVVWFSWRLLGFIDRNIALTEPKSSWIKWFQYKIDQRLNPEKDWEPVPRPRLRLGFWGYTILMLLILLMFLAC